jgi:aconitate decarboxylase
MSVTRELAEIIVGTTYKSIPAEVLRVAGEVCLDGLGVIVAGSREPTGIGRITTDYARSLGGAPQSTVIAGGFQTAAPNAAYANGTMCHALDFDNTLWPSNHPTSPTLPAILAVAERDGLSGEDVLTAIVIAFEVQARMRIASAGVRPGIPGSFHKPGVSGTIGATAAAAKLIGLSAEEMCLAFGIAGSRCGGLTVNTGSMTKSSHSGNAARMGVEAATLAKLGFTAMDDVFGAGLFFDSLWGAGSYDVSLFTRDFGKPYYMVEPGVGFKKHPSNYFTHRPIDAALELRRKHALMPEAIDKVEIDFPRFDYVNRPKPKSGLDGKFSIQYTTAVALLDGAVTIDSFSDARRFAVDLEELLPRVTLMFRDDIPGDFNKTWAVVRVQLRDGRVLEERCDKPRGIWGHPLTRDERLAKFRMCLSPTFSDETADSVIAMVEGLAGMKTIRPLLTALQTPDGD